MHLENGEYDIANAEKLRPETRQRMMSISCFLQFSYGCKSRGIKLSASLAAAGFIAAHASKNLPDDKWEKYSLATLIDCRPLLDPVLSDHHIATCCRICYDIFTNRRNLSTYSHTLKSLIPIPNSNQRGSSNCLVVFYFSQDLVGQINIRFKEKHRGPGSKLKWALCLLIAFHQTS